MATNGGRELKDENITCEYFFGLICDFDLTLTKQHAFLKYRNNMSWQQILDNVNPYVKDTFREALQMGKAGIATNNESGIVQQHLEAAGLSKDELSQIPIKIGNKPNEVAGYIESWYNDPKRNNRKLIVFYLDDEDSYVKNAYKQFLIRKLHEKNIELFAIQVKPGLEAYHEHEFDNLKNVFLIIASSHQKEYKKYTDPILDGFRQPWQKEMQTAFEEIQRQKAEKERLELEQREREAKENTQKVQVFKKIYRALYDGEMTCWKWSSFLNGKENHSTEEMLHAIAMDIAANPHCRTHVAWKLTEKNFRDETLNLNSELFTAIYRYSYEHSGLFKQSKIHSIKVEEYKKDQTRTIMIQKALS